MRPDRRNRPPDSVGARKWTVLGLVTVGLGASTVALGLPWDTDMADGQQRKAYSIEMRSPPEGTVAQPSPTSPKPYAPNYVRGSPEGEALVNPLAIDEHTVAEGKKMFGIYCAPCHGDGIVVGPVAQSATEPQRLKGVAVLAGPAGVAHNYSDGYLYLTVRNGGKLMPSYGWALSEDEIWSVISFVRTLDNAARTAPAPGEAP